MNTLHFRYAVEIEKTRSITQAAENLYMAQPNLSKAIKELENSQMWLTFGNNPHKFNLYMTKLPETNINVFFIKNDWYFTPFKEVYPKYLDPGYEHFFLSCGNGIRKSFEFSTGRNSRKRLAYCNDSNVFTFKLQIR